MESNTVTLPLETYNYLRDFESKVKQGAVCVSKRGMSYNHIEYLTESEAVKELAEENKRLNGNLEGMSSNAVKRVEYMNLKLAESKAELDRVSEMSIWQFIKWRKSKR